MLDDAGAASHLNRRPEGWRRDVMKLSRQITALTVCVLLTAVTAVSALSAYGLYEVFRQQAQSQLQSLAEAKKSAFVAYHNRLLRDVEVQANSILLSDAVLEFDVAWSSLEEVERVALQSLYSDDGFYLAGDYGAHEESSTGYSDVHSRYHSTFLETQQANDFRDLVLLNADGFLVYSTAKQDDFGADFTGPSHRNSALARAFRQYSQQNGSTGPAFFDYHRYEAAGNAVAGFVAAPIIVDDRFRGVLAYQTRLDDVNRLLEAPQGFAETGEILVVGPDLTVRNDTTFTKDAPLNRRLDNEAVQMAFAGHSGFVTTQSTAGYHLAYATPIQIGDETFALVVSQPVTAYLMPFEQLGISLGLALAAVLGLLLFMAITGGRKLARPLEQIAALQKRLASGETNVSNPELTSPREAADLSEATFVFKKQARDVARYRAENGTLDKKKGHVQVSGQLVQQYETTLSSVIEGISHVMPNVARKVTEVSGTTTRLVDQTNTASGNAAKVQGEVDSVAMSAEKANAAFEDVASKLHDTAGLSNSAARQASDAALRLADMTTVSTRLDVLSERISEIASRTNIVSLNASLEAVRAGDVGGGFGVIAREIKSLADQIQRIAEETRQRNSELQAEMEATSTAIRMVSDTAQNATDTVASVEEAVALQAVAAGNVALAARGAANRVQTLVDELGSVNGGASATLTVSNDMQTSAEELVKTGTTLVNEVSRLLEEIKNQS